MDVCVVADHDPTQRPWSKTQDVVPKVPEKPEYIQDIEIEELEEEHDEH